MQPSDQSSHLVRGFFLLISFMFHPLFLRGKAVGLTPNLQSGGPGYYFSSGPSPVAYPVLETLPVATVAPAFLSGKYTFALCIYSFK